MINNRPDTSPYYIYHKYADGSEYRLPVYSLEEADRAIKDIRADSKDSKKRVVEIEVRFRWEGKDGDYYGW